MAPLPLALVVYSAQVLFVVGVAGVASMLFRLTLPAARLAYWRAVGVLCLALPLLTPAHPEGPAATVVFGAAAVVGTGGLASAPTLATVGSLITWMYAGGVAARLGWLLVGALRLRQIRRRSTPAAVGEELEALRTELAPRAELRWTHDLRQPVAFGLRRPVVLLPSRFGALSAEAQRSVTCHELLHVARRDWLWIMVEEHLRAVFWFHPGIWWLLEQIQLNREQVIDRQVVGRMVSKRAYMDALMAFADEGRIASPSVAFLRRRHLKFRIQQLSMEQHMSLRRLAWTMAALVVVMGTTAAGAARALPLDVPSLRAQAGPATVLEVRLAENDPASGLIETPVPGSDRRIYLHPASLATTADVTSASVIDAGNSQFSVAVAFGEAAAARMVSATQAHLGRPVAIVLDGQVLAVMTLRAPVSDSAMITGVTEEQARRLAAGLAGGGPPAPRIPGVARSITPQRAAPVSDVGQLLRRPGAATPPSAGQAAPASSRDDGVTLPEAVVKVNPRYAQAAREAKVQGEVGLTVVVGADGAVGDVTVTSSLDTAYGLDEAAVDAVKQWQFNPGTKNGTPVAVSVDIVMSFTLR